MTQRLRRRAILVAVVLTCVAGCTGPAGSPSGDAASGSPPSALNAPIGTWTTTVTEDELRAAGLTNPGEVTENAGTFTTTFSPQGTWTTSQVSDAPVRWPVFQGTYRAVPGDVLELITTFPTDYAGDVVGVRWRLEGDKLHFELQYPDDEILRLNLEIHPWLRKA
jgi:hypothetical protein